MDRPMSKTGTECVAKTGGNCAPGYSDVVQKTPTLGTLTGNW